MRIAPGLASLLLSVAALAVEPKPLVEDECQAVVETSRGPAEVRDLPGIVVLDEKATGEFKLPGFPDATVKTIVCWRSAARFVPSDRRVSDAGARLAVKAQGAAKNGGDRALVLEKMSGGFRVRVLQGGDLTTDEQAWIVQLLQTLNGAAGVPTFVGTSEKT